MVTITVGKAPYEKTFVVHEDFVCHCSPHMTATFRSHFAKSVSKTLTLDHTTPAAFGIFVKWANMGELCNSNVHNIPISTLVEAWLLADHLGVEELQTKLVQGICIHAGPRCLSDADYTEIWTRTREGSSLRRILIHQIVYYVSDFGFVGEAPLEMAVELLMAMRENYPSNELYLCPDLLDSLENEKKI